MQREQRQSQQDRESSSRNCHTARHRAAVQASQGQTARLFKYWEIGAAQTELQRFLSIWLIKQRQLDQIAQNKRTLRHSILVKNEHWSKISGTTAGSTIYRI